MNGQIVHSSTGEIVVSRTAGLMPALSIEDAIARYQLFGEFVQRVLKEGTDYGKIPGTDKNTLLKAGAEKLTTLFGLSVSFDEPTADEDWTGERHGGEVFFGYRYRCRLYRGETLIALADGSANSWEKKYRWRKADRVCPECEAAAIKRSKYPPKGNPNAKPGWYCFAAVGGCGANFDAADERITGQQAGQVPNPDIADLQNTILKIAQKRSLVAATLIAVNASDYFTQDMEDLAPLAPVVESANEEALAQIVALYRAQNPGVKNKDDAILGALFDKVCGKDSPFTASNALRVALALAAKAAPKAEEVAA